MNNMKLYQAIAQQLNRIASCEAGATGDNAERNIESAHATIEYLMLNMMPRGSGFDAGCALDFEESKENRLVFSTSFHCMDEHGYYCGWRDYKIVVRASLSFEFKLYISGSNWNDLREYVADCFHHALDASVRYATEAELARTGSSIVGSDAKAEARAAKAGERKAAAAAYHAQRKARQAALWRSNFLMYVYKGNRDDGRVLTISHPLLPDPTVATHEELLASGWVLAQCKAVEVRDPQP